MKTIVIDGEKYIKKSELKEEKVLKDYVIIRTRFAGVFAGYVVKKEGNEVELKNARRIWYWDGAASLSQLAIDGTNKPGNCKFPCEVPKIILLNVIEIISCTEKSRKSIAQVAIWTK